MNQTRLPRSVFFSLFLGLAFLSFWLTNCGTGVTTDGSDSSGNSAGITTAASLGSSVQGGDAGSVAYYLPSTQTLPQRLWAMGETLFSILPAEAATCSLADAECSAGVVTMTFAGCTTKNGKMTLTGGFTITLQGQTTCPGAGFWKYFFTTNNATIFRTFTADSSEKNTSGITVTLNNTNPTGWDSGVILSKGAFANYGLIRVSHGGVSDGTTYTVSETLTNTGVEHVATGGTATALWDHTISFTTVNVTRQYNATGTLGTKNLVSVSSGTGTVIVQHNLAKWTAQSTLNSVTFDQGTASTGFCGCLPTGGNIQSAYTGTKTNYEVVTFTYSSTGTCGSYSLQGYSDNAYSVLSGGATTGVLAHCL